MAGRQLAPRVAELAPGLTTSFVREALHRAIVGFGPFSGTAKAADKALEHHDGDAEKAVRELIDDHIRLAGAQGLVTNIGGLVTMTVTVPTNITGLCVLQCRMVAGIAHLRGYDLDDPRTRNAILVCLLGHEKVDQLVGRKRLAGPPMALATAPVHDTSIDAVVAAEVAADLIARVTGRRLAVTVGRRIPLMGGVVGMGADGWSTYKVGHYADGELLPRAAR